MQPSTFMPQQCWGRNLNWSLSRILSALVWRTSDVIHLTGAMGTLPTGSANQNSLTAISSKAELHGWPSVCINLWYIKFLLSMYPTACNSNKQFAISPCPWFEASAEHKINTYVLVYSNRQCVSFMGKPVHNMGRIKLLAASLQEALLWSKSSWPHWVFKNSVGLPLNGKRVHKR